MITADTAFRMPAAPRTIEETGLSPDLILQIVTKTLHFAGEACDVSGEAGTVGGALASGRRAAREILDAAWREPPGDSAYSAGSTVVKDSAPNEQEPGEDRQADFQTHSSAETR